MNLPKGAACSATSAGLKAGGGPDLGLVLFTERVAWAGAFTRNGAAAAPVRWCRERLGTPVRALVVNSGNANACTGTAGDAAVRATAEAAAAAVRCAPDEVLVASTGPIGVPLPVDLVTEALGSLATTAGPDLRPFGEAILTTDRRVKTAGADAGDARVVGVAKGAAMLAPGMATMLGFVFTDAALDEGQLAFELTRAVGRTFNRISVDACESTNDSVFLFSTGTAGAAEPDAVGKAVEEVCASLAEQMVRDAEGGSKLVRVRIDGAATEESAASLARAVAASDLWRAAAGGGDPNWGRVVAALGSVDRDLDLSSLQVWIGSEPVFSNGEPAGSLDAAATAMAGDEFTVRCSVGDGPAAVEFLTSDLSEEYVTLNATGTS